MPDQPGLPQNGSGRWTGGSSHHPSALRLTNDYHCVDTVVVRLCCVGSPLSDREQVLKRSSGTPALKWSRLEPFVCNPVLAGDVMSTRTGWEAAVSYDWHGSDSWCVRAQSVIHVESGFK